MKAITPYRVAAVLLALFFLGHTGGGMIAQKSLGDAADSVFAMMKSVHFTFNGADSTWYGFWFGFGLTASIFLFFSAVLAWQLDKLDPAQFAPLSTVAWTFVAAHAANTYLSWRYFFAGPAIFSVLITALLALGAWRKRRPA